MQVVHRRRELVPDAQVQREVASQMKIVLSVISGGPLPSGETLRPDAAGCLIRDSEEHGGERAARAVVGCRAARVAVVEVECAERVWGLVAAIADLQHFG